GEEPAGSALPALDDRCALFDRVVNMAFDFLNGRHVDQRALCDAFFEPWSYLQPSDGIAQAACELIVDAGRTEESIRAYTGLAVIAILRDNRPSNRRIEIRIVEDDERGVAAELEGHFLHRAGALGHEQLADFGRARERNFADDRVGRELAA